MACIGILDATVNRRQGFGVQCDLIGCGHLEFQIHHASKVASGEGVCQIQSQRFVRVSDFPSACPELPGCASAGDTEEARQNIEEAIKLYLAPSEIDLPARAKLLEVTIG